MNALIGNNEAVKLILLSCEDDSMVPTKKDIKGFFPGSAVSIYKASGRFKDSFWEMESLMKNRLKGSTSQAWWGGCSCITHAIRLDKDCERSLFFDLKYSEILVNHLKLDHRSLEKLHDSIVSIAKFNSEIASITNCVEKFQSVKDAINRMGLHDPKVDNPCKDAIATLFDDYGKQARVKIDSYIEAWYQKHYWA